jgi:hypothetical protein
VLTAAVGSLVGALSAGALGLVAWLYLGGGEVRAHNLQVSDRNVDLRTWIADRDIELTAQLLGIDAEASARNVLQSGQRLTIRSNAKSQALHEYRDQKRGADRLRSEIEARENLRHRFWRRKLGDLSPIDAAREPGSVELLQRWRQMEGEVSVYDPTREGRALTSHLASQPIGDFD